MIIGGVWWMAATTVACGADVAAEDSHLPERLSWLWQPQQSTVVIATTTTIGGELGGGEARPGGGARVGM